ncbi:MAG: hypothetical protein U0800_25560 [Isosphaeraceae bacterium]
MPRPAGVLNSSFGGFDLLVLAVEEDQLDRVAHLAAEPGEHAAGGQVALGQILVGGLDLGDRLLHVVAVGVEAGSSRA